jgi:hypothetical protein
MKIYHKHVLGLINVDHEREARTKSARYFLNALLSKSLSFVANSTAASCGQLWAGKKTAAKNSKASRPRALETACRRLQISCKTCNRVVVLSSKFYVETGLTTSICPSLILNCGDDNTAKADGIKRSYTNRSKPGKG